MSADLEKLGQLYREQYGDEDVADMLATIAGISRRRGRAEYLFEQQTHQERRQQYKFVFESSDWWKDPLEQRMQTLSDEKRGEYKNAQVSVLAAFQFVMPKGTYVRSYDLYRKRDALNKLITPPISGDTLLPYIMLPSISHTWRIFFRNDLRYSFLLEEGREVATKAKTEYNDYIYSYMRVGLQTLDDVLKNGYGYNYEFVNHFAYPTLRDIFSK